MHSELALNRCKLVSALIKMSFRLQIILRNKNLFRTKFLPFFYITKPSDNGNHITPLTPATVRTRAVQTQPWALPATATMCWSKTTTHPHIIPPMVLVLPFWVWPGKDKAFPVQQCKLSTMQVLAGTYSACAEVQQSEKSFSHKKKALPHSEPCPQPQPKIPRTVTTICRRGHSQPLGIGQAGTAAVTSGPGNPIPAQPWAPPCRHHRKKGANPARLRVLSNTTLLRRDSWAHTSFPGKSV